MKSRARQQPAAKPSSGRTAVMYVRVSSKEQEQGFSIAAQRQLLTDYAEREGIHVLQEFEDIETAAEVMAVPVIVRDHYLQAIGGLIETYKRELGATGIDYHLLTIDQPLELALLAYLSTRGRAL